MARRLLSASAHAELLGVPTTPEALTRYYLLTNEDHDLDPHQAPSGQPTRFGGSHILAAPSWHGLER